MKPKQQPAAMLGGKGLDKEVEHPSCPTTSNGIGHFQKGRPQLI